MHPIIVFGSAHLDVYARAPQSLANFRDRPGDVSYSVGGSAFNLAKQLTLLGKEVCLFTHLPKRSFISSAIKAEIAAAGISNKFIVLDERMRESGFVALVRGNRLEQAVSCMAIERAKLDGELVKKAVKASQFVVLDCNLSVGQIELISSSAWKNGKEVVISPVSSAKSGRYLAAKIPNNRRFLLVSLNQAEAGYILGELPKNIMTWPADAMLDRFKTANLIISLGAAGHLIFDSAGMKHVSAPSVEMTECSSELGAGDALLAAHCACVASDFRINWSNAEKLSNRLIVETFSSLSATPDMQRGGVRNHVKRYQSD